MVVDPYIHFHIQEFFMIIILLRDKIDYIDIKIKETTWFTYYPDANESSISTDDMMPESYPKETRFKFIKLK
jgi:hypothetical protein